MTADAILKKKARLAEIERSLTRPLPAEWRGQAVSGGSGWRLGLEEERQHLVIAVAELEKDALLQRSSGPVGQASKAEAATEVERKPYEHAIASYKRRLENSGMPEGRRANASLPDGQKKGALLGIGLPELDFIKREVWKKFFEEAGLPRAVEGEWDSVLSNRKVPDSDVVLGLTLALTREYVKAISRASGTLADLLVAAAISRVSRIQITAYFRETIWRECLDFAGQLGQWDVFASWVDRVTHVCWQAPHTADGAVDREQLERAVQPRREFFEKRIAMYWRDWLGTVDRAIELRCMASPVQNKPRRPGGTVLQYDRWRELRDEFALLASEERTISQRRSKDLVLRVYAEYNLDRTVAEDELISQGRMCLPYRLESGKWYVSEGPNEDFKVRFEALATRAGNELGSPRGTLPLHFWLHSISLHLRRTDSKELFACSDTGGIITHACQVSATFCSQLERKALETAALVPERNAKRWKPERGDADVAKRNSLVRSNPNTSADEICEIFDRESVPLPPKWGEAGFRTWSRAYKDSKHRNRIHVVISKARRKD